MGGFTEVSVGNIKVKHHSTSSVISVTVFRDEEVSQGKVEPAEDRYWFEYDELRDLKDALNKIDI